MEIAEHIQILYQLLGEDVVLLPVPLGKKGPLVKNWQKVSFAQTQTSEYQSQLASGNIGVLLGESSGGLCAIDIDDDQDVEPFLDLNPELQDTLITKGARGVQVWIRCAENLKYQSIGLESYPKTYAIRFKPGVRDKISSTNPNDRHPGPFGEWRSTGGQSIVYGKHPSGNDYTFYNKAPVKSYLFQSIRWPDSVEQQWKKEIGQGLLKRYGEPWVPDGKGEPTGMNEQYYAGLFAFHNEVIYENEEERYYLYNPASGLWERTKEEDIYCRISDMLLKASRTQKQPILGTMRFRSAAKVSRISIFLKGLVGRQNIFKRRRGLIHLQNGMLDLMAVDDEDPHLRLLPFSPTYYSRNQIPLRFDAKAQCPIFKNDLLNRALKKEDVALMKRWGGLLLLQENIYSKIMILTGTAGSGKSTIMSIFQKIVGQSNCAQLRTEQLLERFEMAAFIGKSTLIGADVPGSFLMQRGAYKLKQLTGGDFIQAEIKTARDLVTLRGDFNVGITCNSRLKVINDSDSDAWERRLIICKCECPPIKEKKSNFDEFLIRIEGSGIVNFLIEGALEILREKKFKMTESQLGSVQDLLEESDSLRSFVRRCVVPADRTDDVTTEEIVKAYHEFCDDRGWDPITGKKLENHLPDILLEIRRVNKRTDIEREGSNRRGYKGIKLIKVTDESHIYEGAES